MNPEVFKAPTPNANSTPLPKSLLLIGLGGILLAIGSLLPWVTIGSVLSISGVSARWGLVTLLAGILLLAIAVQIGTGRLMARSANRSLAIVGVVLGLAGLALALYVGFAIRGAVADSKSDISATAEASTGSDEFDASLDDFARGLQELFKVGTGIGVYVTGFGGVLAATGSGLALRRSPEPA